MLSRTCRNAGPERCAVDECLHVEQREALKALTEEERLHLLTECRKEGRRGYSNIRFTRIFAGFISEGEEASNNTGWSIAAIFSVFGVCIFGTFRNKANIIGL